MLTVKKCKKNFCILFSSKHTKGIINIAFMHENLSFVKFLQPFVFVIAHELLDPVIPKEHCSKDLFSFSEEIQQVSGNDNFLVSYDVWSLFTSINLQETIETAFKLIFENNSQLKITKRELKQLFNFATSGTHFVFNGSFYDQIDGVSMGHPLGPVLTNLNLTKERFSCINAMLMISFVCFELKRMQKIFLNFLTASIKI